MKADEKTNKKKEGAKKKKNSQKKRKIRPKKKKVEKNLSDLDNSTAGPLNEQKDVDIEGDSSPKNPKKSKNKLTLSKSKDRKSLGG